jgi:glutaredoxin
MKAIIIGTKICPFCVTAKNFATERNIPYDYKILNEDINMEEAIKLVGQTFRSVPQIIVDGKHVGGCDDFIRYINAKEINDDDFKDMSL